MSHIIIFGDSITYGASDIKGGWVSRLRNYVDQKSFDDENYYKIVMNLGISGNTSDDLINRFEFELKQRIREGRETVIIIAIGTNDSQEIAGNLKIDQAKYKNNIQKLTKIAQKYSTKIVFVGLFPVDESKTCPTPWHEDQFYKNENIGIYNQIIADLCEENNLIFIDIYNNFINQNYINLLDDGLHPNTEGHQKMFEIIKKELENNKII